MVFFTKSEERERNKSTEKTLEATHYILSDASLSTVMPKTQKILLNTLNSVYIPNVFDGVITKPRSVKDPNAIPAVSFRKGEALQSSPSIWSMLPLQEKAYVDYVISQGAEDTPEQKEAELVALRSLFDMEVQASTEVSLPERAEGMVTRPKAAIRIKSRTHSTDMDRFFYGRPLVGFRMTEDFDAHPGIVGFHELVHVAQTPKQIRTKLDLETRQRLKFERELEAYHYQAVAIRALYTTSSNTEIKGNPRLLKGHALAIEELRAKENENRRNPFEPTGRLRNLLLDVGIDI